MAKTKSSKGIKRFEVFTVVMIQVEVFWFVTLCSIAVGFQYFGRPCCLHIQNEDEGSIDL
jgi:hypothetical protein